MPLTQVTQMGEIPRCLLPAVRHVTVPSFNHQFIRYYLSFDIVRYAKYLKPSKDEEEVLRKKPIQPGRGMYGTRIITQGYAQ